MYRPHEAHEYIMREWTNNPLKLGESANLVFSTEEGIKKQIQSLYDTTGTIFYFIQRGDLIELVPMEVDYRIDRPDGFKFMGYDL